MSKELWQKFERLARETREGVESALHMEVEALFAALSGNRHESLADKAIYC